MIEITRDEEKHTGPACYREHKHKGRPSSVTVMCPYGHLVTVVDPWAGSTWQCKASFGDDIVTCHGALRPNARPYPFKDTFLGRVKERGYTSIGAVGLGLFLVFAALEGIARFGGHEAELVTMMAR